MNAKLIMYAEPILQLLALSNYKKEDIPKQVGLSEEEVCQILKYLRDNGTVNYHSTFGRGFSGVKSLEVTSKGAEVALNKRKLIETVKSNFQQMNINAPVQNIAQLQGNNNVITQTIDNSQYAVLKQMIEKDTELDTPKKKSLLDLLEKFNTLKESGENAYELLKSVGGIAIKYLPLFFGLLK